jgi:hypothetical protein
MAAAAAEPIHGGRAGVNRCGPGIFQPMMPNSGSRSSGHIMFQRLDIAAWVRREVIPLRCNMLSATSVFFK